MTESETRLARAERDLIDSFLLRFEQIEAALRVAGISMRGPDAHTARAVREWNEAREEAWAQEFEDPRR